MSLSTRDIVVIGASAGGFAPLSKLVGELPTGFPAAVFIVMHLGAGSKLPEALSRAHHLPVHWATSGAAVKRGTISVAPPGVHLLLHDGHALLRRGPRENLARPSIDVLFRSAAASYGGRVIGVLLSGALNDGTAGMLAIARCGGIGIVQDPAEAAVRDMPQSAIRRGIVDHIAAVADMPDLLARLVREPAGATPQIPLSVRLESAIAAQQLSDIETPDKLGTLSPFTCPECHGTLWEIDDGTMLRYRCHAGHAYSAKSMLAAQAEEIDRTLQILLRLRQERAGLARRMIDKERARNRHDIADQMEARARDYDEDARLMHLLLLGAGTPASPAEGDKTGNGDSEGEG